MEGIKLDSGKVRMDLLPPDALLAIAQVLTYGSKKYGDRNWEKGIQASRLEAAALRHLFKWKLHEEEDPEFGLHHLAHFATNALMMLAHRLRFTPGFDDRADVFVFDPKLREVFETREMPPKCQCGHESLEEDPLFDDDEDEFEEAFDADEFSPRP